MKKKLLNLDKKKMGRKKKSPANKRSSFTKKKNYEKNYKPNLF